MPDPKAPHAPAHAKPEPPPVRPPKPEYEAPPSGLGTFNLGTIPASVTPPRSWRRAAWFAIFTAVTVMVGLMFASVALITRPVDRVEMIDSLPGYGSRSLRIVELPDQRTDRRAAQRGSSSRSSTSSTTSPTSSSGPPEQADSEAAPTTGGTPSTTQTPSGMPSEPGEAPPSTTTSQPEPSRTTVVAPVRPGRTNPDAMGDRTVRYFSLVAEEPAAAHQMTSGDLRDEGTGGIEARYGDVRSIEVREVTIDPTWSTTRSRLTIVYEDGTVITEERELTFSYGDDPKISQDRQV